MATRTRTLSRFELAPATTVAALIGFAAAPAQAAIFSFLRTSDSASGSVDILPILKGIKDTKGWWGNETIGDVQFGYEITSSPGGLNFTTNGFGVSAS